MRHTRNSSTELEINGELDLHTFRPGDVSSLQAEYIGACIERDIHLLRIIHGKGTGTLRRRVHAALARDPRVLAYNLAGDRSSWGATVVRLRVG